MKLPNFLLDGSLNALRETMGAPLCQSFRLDPSLRKIELPPLMEMLNSVGVEVGIDQISLLDDGTLGLGTSRVLLYIRDVAYYGDSGKLPKYHLMYCKTLEEMHSKRRFQRYVVANRDDGNFLVNLMGEKQEAKYIKLHVCQFCLLGLKWRGFSFMLGSEERTQYVRSFALTDFFDAYPKDLISINPPHTSDSAPLNDYSPDWQEISSRTKSEKGYQCQTCKLILQVGRRHFLHVHHVNGLKYDNSSDNLKVVCIACHSDEPLHSHMRASVEYREFMALTGRE